MTTDVKKVRITIMMNLYRNLIQVFFTHKGRIEKQSTQEDRDAVRQSLGDNVEPLDQKEEDELLDAYK